MATTLASASLTLAARVAISQSAGNTNLDSGSTLTPTISLTNTFANGTAALQATKVFSGSRLLSATSETLDLTALTDPFGNAVDFTSTGIKGVVIYNTNTTTGAVLAIGGAAATQWIGTTSGNVGPFVDVSDIIKIGAGGVFVVMSPTDAFGVSAGSKSLKINSGSATITYQILLWG